MSLRAAKRFHITNISDPDRKGPLNLYFIFQGGYEIDYGSEIERTYGKFSLRLSDQNLYRIAMGDENSAEAIARAKGRIAYFIKDKLKEILGDPSASSEQYFELNDKEIEDLLRIKPEVVKIDEWQEIQTYIRKNQIFISCGQRSEEEKELGKQIAIIIESKTSYRPYFAQSEMNLDGMTSNIFRALHQSSGIIAVLHKRDLLNDGEYRGSLWIEQEIAVAAFLSQELSSVLPTRAYVQNGVRREGVREFIMLNPIVFETYETILDDLEKWLPGLDKIRSTDD